MVCPTDAQTIDDDSLEIDSAFLFMNDSAVFFDELSRIDPIKAALYSAVVPGLGQIYNGQPWKVPIIYGGGIAFAHIINFNHRMYSQFRAAQLANKSTADFATNPFEPYAPGSYTDSNITRNAERFRRNRDYMIILASAFYLINIVEAHIAAHLKEFDINEELSFQIHPSFESTPLFSRSTGIGITLRF